MNLDHFKLCAKLIPSGYVQQGENGRKSQEHKIKILLEHVSIKQLKSVLRVAMTSCLFSLLCFLMNIMLLSKVLNNFHSKLH